MVCESYKSSLKEHHGASSVCPFPLNPHPLIGRSEMVRSRGLSIEPYHLKSDFSSSRMSFNGHSLPVEGHFLVLANDMGLIYTFHMHFIGYLRDIQRALDSAGIASLFRNWDSCRNIVLPFADPLFPRFLHITHDTIRRAHSTSARLSPRWILQGLHPSSNTRTPVILCEYGYQWRNGFWSLNTCYKALERTRHCFWPAVSSGIIVYKTANQGYRHCMTT